MAGAPPGTAKLVIKEVCIAGVLGFVCAMPWKYYHNSIKKKTTSFYDMLDRGEISVVASEDE